MIFVDSSALIALFFVSDKFHKRAIKFQLNNVSEKFVTSNIVVIEALGWIRYKLGQKRAVDAGEKIFWSKDLDILNVSSDDENEAWKYFKEIKGDGVSMVDCTSFAIMKRKGITKVFTFDQDFKKAGFTVLPK